MGTLDDIISGKITRKGVHVVKSEKGAALVFENYAALHENRDIADDISKRFIPTFVWPRKRFNKSMLENWGLNNDGTPVIIDQG